MNEVQKEIMEIVGLLWTMSISELKELWEEWLKESEKHFYSSDSMKLCEDIMNAVLGAKEETTI